MKRTLAIILALVLCVGVFATVGFAAEEEKYIELTAANLLGYSTENVAYGAGEKTISDVKFAYTEVGCYGTGIQMRVNKNSTETPKVHATLWNASALPGNITKIELTYSAAQEVKYANEEFYFFTFGTSAEDLGHSVSLNTVKGEKSYTITPDAGTYTYFKMEQNVNQQYTSYWDSIKIYYKEAAQAPVEKPAEAEKVTVHAQVPAAWENANCYVWGDAGEVLGAWSGTAMTLNNGWYEIEVPNTTVNMIINNGSEQTIDLALEAGKEVWITLGEKDGAGKYEATVSYTNPNPAPSNPVEKPDDNKENSKTGDATALVAISAAMLLAATGVVAVVSNKKHF